jgi:hypothetical protein
MRARGIVAFTLAVLIVMRIFSSGIFGDLNAEPSAGRDALRPTQRSIHLYGGDLTVGAPLAAWYKELGITDLWLYPLRGAFPQDQHASDQRSIDDLESGGILKAYGDHGLRYWWFERPVPDYVYYLQMQRPDAGTDGIWGSGEWVDSLWESLCTKVEALYAEVRRAGFSGIVYDNEAYYSYRSKSRTWLWEGHAKQLGQAGAYYQRGLQVGSSIAAAWPNAPLIMVYAHGYPAEYWWYKGFQDAGLDLYLGIEQTYGAGPWKPGDAWYQHWWHAHRLRGVVRDKRNQFRFIQDDRHIISGLFPVDFSARKPNYDLRFFKQQLEEAASLGGPGPFAVWLWPQGPFTPRAWAEIHLPSGAQAQDYWTQMREFSGSSSNGPGR